MKRFRPVRPGILIGCVTLLTGCADWWWDHDHLDRIDTIDWRAGDVQQHNITVQAANPRPADRSAPVFDGERILKAVEGYRDGAAPLSSDAGEVGTSTAPAAAEGAE